MTARSLRYTLPNDWGRLELSPIVLAHFEAHRQRLFFSPEAGGQLFASFADPSLMDVVEATGPRPTDRRSVFSYLPDREAEKVEIRDRFARGLHFVGDWHSHRQDVPSPSSQDMDSIQHMVDLSSHELVGFLLVIVGRKPFPEGLHVSLQTKERFWVCTAE